jgi:hypothetical protein
LTASLCGSQGAPGHRLTRLTWRSPWQFGSRAYVGPDSACARGELGRAGLGGGVRGGGETARRKLSRDSWTFNRFRVCWQPACPTPVKQVNWTSGPEIGLPAAFRPDSSGDSFTMGPPAGFRPAGGPILRFYRLDSGRNLARKPDFRPGSTIALYRGATNAGL